MISIDGSFGEGGGQILRTAIALSCVTGVDVEVFNIRANRPKPGLAMQHMKGIEAAKLMSNADVEGLKKGSTRVVFRPRKLKAGKYRIDVGTAGSVSLVLQVLIPVAMKAGECEITVTGGTDVKWAPPVDYLRNVTLRAVAEMGGKTELKLIRRGYYPKGGGKVIAKTERSELRGVEFEAREVKKVSGISHCSNLPLHVAERQANSAEELIEKRGLKAEVEVECRRDPSTGSGITLWCDSRFVGGSALGEKGKRAEVVGKEAAESLLKGLNGNALDEWVGDQIMIFAALARGVTVYTVSEVTKHQISNAYVINSFFENCVEIDGKKIKITGQGIL